MHPGCRGRCFYESKPHVDFSKTYLEDYPYIYKRCRTCGYSIRTTETRCYCCHNPYSTRPIGSSRKKTTEIILQVKRRYRNGISL